MAYARVEIDHDVVLTDHFEIPGIYLGVGRRVDGLSGRIAHLAEPGEQTRFHLEHDIQNASLQGGDAVGRCLDEGDEQVSILSLDLGDHLDGRGGDLREHGEEGEGLDAALVLQHAGDAVDVHGGAQERTLFRRYGVVLVRVHTPVGHIVQIRGTDHVIRELGEVQVRVDQRTLVTGSREVVHRRRAALGWGEGPVYALGPFGVPG